MRPAYRYALAAGLATVLAIGLGLWVSVPESHDPTAPVDFEVSEDHVTQPLRPEGVEKVDEPIIGDPGPGVRAELLDDIEAFEVDRFGAAEAARRREAREQLLEDRMNEFEKRDKER